MIPCRVVLVEDHALVRAGIRMLLEKIPGVQVIGEASDGAEAVKEVSRLTPDLVLLDIAMPLLNGLEALVRIKKTMSGTRVIMLSMYADEAYLYQALRAGADGYILKDAERSELESAIKTVMSGVPYLTPAVAQIAVESFRGRSPAEKNPLEKLTSRQREVLQLIAEGYKTKDIAQRLSLGVRTVETHRAELMSRLQIHDVPGLVKFAIAQGLTKSR